MHILSNQFRVASTIAGWLATYEHVLGSAAFYEWVDQMKWYWYCSCNICVIQIGALKVWCQIQEGWSKIPDLFASEIIVSGCGVDRCTRETAMTKRSTVWTQQPLQGRMTYNGMRTCYTKRCVLLNHLAWRHAVLSYQDPIVGKGSRDVPGAQRSVRSCSFFSDITWLDSHWSSQAPWPANLVGCAPHSS